MYQERSYANARVQGPSVIVMPGEIKSNNATFRQKITANNIKDFAELELSRANFRVLERGDIDSLLREQQLAHEMGSADRGSSKKGSSRPPSGLCALTSSRLNRLPPPHRVLMEAWQAI